MSEAQDASPTGPQPLLSAQNLRKEFGSRSSFLSRNPPPPAVAVDGVSFDIQAGECLGLVGESGSGKSTTARLVLRLIEPTDGTVWFEGQDITALKGRPLRSIRSRMQAVFQDISGALNAKMTVADIVGEPLRFHKGMGKTERRKEIGNILETVGLSRDYMARYPYELSGGQRQRVGLARALAVEPKLLVLDEPVSALDVSTQSQAINLLSDLQTDLDVAYLFIAHDLFVVHHVSHRIGVMYLGAMMELGAADQVYAHPRHPYTQALLSAIPHPDPTVEQSRERIILRGDVPSPTAIPSGCRFRTRCSYAWDKCREEVPELITLADGGSVACHLHTDGPKLAGRSVNEVTDLMTQPTG